MKNLIRSAALAIAVLSLVAPDAAQAQTKPALVVKTLSTVKKAPTPAPAGEARWTSMLGSMAVLAQEGLEIKRVTPAEKAQIDSTITKVKQQIAAAKTGGISEVEEDAIDTAIANEMVTIAKAMSDPVRKAAPAPAPAKK